MSGRMTGLVAVVTGGGSGIGAATAAAFHAEGAQVAVLDRDARNAAKTAADLPGAISIVVDIADSAAVDAAIEGVVSTLGTVDVLANFAGIDDPEAKARTAACRVAGEPLDITATMTDAAWRRIMSVNLDGSFYMLRAALRVMTAQGSGSIINMSSLAGVIGAAGSPHYSAAKAAIVGLTQSVAREVAPLGVRVNAIAPGPVITPMLLRTTGDLDMSGEPTAAGSAAEAPAASVSAAGVPAPVAGEPAAGAPAAGAPAIPPMPMLRFADASEVASVAVFLACADSSYVTGDVIHIDGALRAV